MELKEILAISGQPGLYKFVAQSKNGIIVESLADGRRSNASGTSKVSAMSEIAIFTDGEDIPLAQVFEQMFTLTGGKETVSHKASAAEIEKAFAQAVPGYDRDRVHSSDMKKVIQWYNTLVKAGMTEFKIEDEEAEVEESPKADAKTEAKSKTKSEPKAKPASAAKPKTAASKSAAKPAPKAAAGKGKQGTVKK